MQQHIYYTKYALQFADMQIPELVNIFNSQVQSRGWSSMRAYHDQALIDEFQPDCHRIIPSNVLCPCRLLLAGVEYVYSIGLIILLFGQIPFL